MQLSDGALKPSCTLVTEGKLSLQTLCTLSGHIVGGKVVLPGVGHVELAFASEKLTNQVALSAVSFLRPCVLPASGRDQRVV